jgi:hypothetical protein
VHQWPAGGVGVGFQTEEHIVGRTDLVRVVGRGRTREEVPTRAQHAHAVIAEGPQVGAAGDQMDFGSGAVQGRADIGADGAGSDNSDFHKALRSRSFVSRMSVL